MANPPDNKQHTIPYAVRYSRRRTLQITVKRDLAIVVSAPQGTRDEKIKDFVAQRAGWIKKQQLFFEQLPKRTSKQYVAGEQHYFLGIPYKLELHKASKQQTELNEDSLFISHSGNYNAQKIEKLLLNWYRKKADELFSERLRYYVSVFSEFQNYNLSLRIRRMKARWGSLNRSGIVNLNLDLIKTPVECIDYVIVHELCHIKHPNHSSAFYKKLEKYMPDYKNRKQQLESCPL